MCRNNPDSQVSDRIQRVQTLSSITTSIRLDCSENLCYIYNNNYERGGRMAIPRINSPVQLKLGCAGERR